MAAEWFYQAGGQQLGPIASGNYNDWPSRASSRPICWSAKGPMVVGSGPKRSRGSFNGAIRHPKLPLPTFKGSLSLAAVALSAETELPPGPSPPPLPPRTVPAMSGSPRRMRVWILAGTLAAGGVAMVVLLAGVLMLHHSGKDVAGPTPESGNWWQSAPLVEENQPAVAANQVPVWSPADKNIPPPPGLSVPSCARLPRSLGNETRLSA